MPLETEQRVAVCNVKAKNVESFGALGLCL